MKDLDVTWRIAATLPDISASQKNIGLAGLMSGVSDNALLVAGGSNFPGAMPWNGGKKKYYNHIYVIEETKNSTTIFLLKDTLHIPVAYAASVSVKEGVICIGGENENGISRNVFLMQLNKNAKSVSLKSLPALPFPLTNTSACAIGSTVFVAGGENETSAVNCFLSLDLNNEKTEWKILPHLPIALSHAVTIAQTNGKEDCIYVIGGRTKTPSGMSDLHGTVFCYHVSKNKWEKKKLLHDENGVAMNLSAAVGVALNDNNILMAGGDDGKVFSRIEKLNAAIASEKNDDEKRRLIERKMELINHHPGFSKKVWLYNTLTGEWKALSPLPYAPVTTTVVKWNDKIFIPGGEIKPGVRTENILCGEIEKNSQNGD